MGIGSLVKFVELFLPIIKSVVTKRQTAFTGNSQDASLIVTIIGSCVSRRNFAPSIKYFEPHSQNSAYESKNIFSKKYFSHYYQIILHDLAMQVFSRCTHISREWRHIVLIFAWVCVGNTHTIWTKVLHWHIQYSLYLEIYALVKKMKLSGKLDWFDHISKIKNQK